METHDLRATRVSGFRFEAAWSPDAFLILRTQRRLSLERVREGIAERLGADRAPSISALGRWNKEGSGGPRDLETLGALASVLGADPGAFYRPEPATLSELAALEIR